MGKRVVVERAGVVQVVGKVGQYKPQAHRNAESKHTPDDNESPLSHSAQLYLLLFFSGWVTHESRDRSTCGDTTGIEGFADFAHVEIVFPPEAGRLFFRECSPA